MKVYIKTFGCSLNYADSEAIAGQLKGKHELVSDPKDADVIIVNSCTVKNEAETKLFRELRKNKDKKIIIAGCVPQAEPSYLLCKFKDYSVLGINQIDKVNEIIDSKEILHLTKKEHKQRINFPIIRSHAAAEIIPICEGCLDSCTYCKTKHARGTLYSYRPRDIREKAEKAIKESVKEIWLTSQDNGCYGYDIGTDSAELLRSICKIKGDFKIRYGMANPNNIKKIKDKLLDSFKHEKVYKFLHIPIQSGSNKVLKEMKRQYSSEEYLLLVEEFRKEIPGITISTDIIVGYPTETEEDFKDTLRIIKESRPEVVNISRFWSRPGTIASKLKPLDTRIPLRRSKMLKSLCNNIGLERNRKYVGETISILIDEIGKDNTFKGRSDNYTQVITKKKCKIGDRLSVKIKTATAIDLRDF